MAGIHGTNNTTLIRNTLDGYSKRAVPYRIPTELLAPGRPAKGNSKESGASGRQGDEPARAKEVSHFPNYRLSGPGAPHIAWTSLPTRERKSGVLYKNINRVYRKITY